MTDGLRSHIEDPGPMGKGFAADMIGGGSVRYLNKLARGEQMDAMDYLIPGLELPGGALTAGAHKLGSKAADFLEDVGAAAKRGPLRGEQVDLGRRKATQALGIGTAALGTGAYIGMGAKQVAKKLGKQGGKVATKQATKYAPELVEQQMKKVLDEANFANHPDYLHPNIEEILRADGNGKVVDDLREAVGNAWDVANKRFKEDWGVGKEGRQYISSEAEKVKRRYATEISQAVEKNIRKITDHPDRYREIVSDKEWVRMENMLGSANELRRMLAQ
jgi:hypothetical protein